MPRSSIAIINNENVRITVLFIGFHFTRDYRLIFLTLSVLFIFHVFFQILSRGGHVNDRDGLTDMTLLHYAAKAGARGVGDADEACRMVSIH